MIKKSMDTGEFVLVVFCFILTTLIMQSPSVNIILIVILIIMLCQLMCQDGAMMR
jgi:hypothetical protein